MIRTDERLTKLGAELDTLAQQRAVQHSARTSLPPQHEELLSRRRVVGPSVAAITAAAVVIALVALLLVTRSGDQASNGANRTPAAGRSTSTAAGRPTRVTAEQLAAHSGIGAPAGWVPVDGPTARIYVPADWKAARVGDCIGTITGIVDIGELPQANCSAFLSLAYPTDGAALLLGPTSVKGTPVKTVHGLAVYGPDTTTDPAWAIYTVPALATKVAVRGAYADQLLDTLTLPASTVASVTAASMKPSTLARYTKSGKRESFRSTYQLTVPSNWHVIEPDFGLCGPPRSDQPELVKVDAGLPQPSCAQIPASASLLGDGALLYWPGATAADTSAGVNVSAQPIVTLRRSSAVVRAYTLDYDTGALLVSITVGRAQPRVMTLLLGRDGRVAGRILASIQSNS
jgi:hypothetical protein